MKKDLAALVLTELKTHAQQSVSGEQLSQKLNISRTAVWKHIKKLQSQGYEIKANGKLGYQLCFEPHPIEAVKLNASEHASFKLNAICKQQVESTQHEAKLLAEQGAEQGTLIIAEQQLSGRGRLGRAWQSPYGKGIWMSLILRPQVPLQFAPQLTLLVAVALCHTIRTTLDLPSTIKWPNDVLINGKKCSGILLESFAEEQQLKYVIAGIGINVNISYEDFDEKLHNIATSLRIEAGKVIDRTQLLVDFYSILDQLLVEYNEHGFNPIVKKWESYADGFGILKEIKLADQLFLAVPFKLDESGALWVRHQDGREERLFAAEIGEVRK